MRAVFMLQFLLVLHLSNVVRGSGEDRYITCAEMSNYCTARGVVLQNIGSDVSHRHPLYRPGKAGVKGQKGDIGPPGINSKPDYDEFERRILTKVKEMITNCRVFYKNSCFKLVGQSGVRHSKDELQQKCADLGGRLANVYSEEHRRIVSRYARAEFGKYTEIAIGMTYSVQNNNFRLTSGELVDIEFQWHPTYPLSDENKQNMFFSIQSDAATLQQGVFNHLPSLHEAYGLCEFNINV